VVGNCSVSSGPALCVQAEPASSLRRTNVTTSQTQATLQQLQDKSFYITKPTSSLSLSLSFSLSVSLSLLNNKQKVLICKEQKMHMKSLKIFPS
jgi:hypothetical protein